MLSLALSSEGQQAAATMVNKRELATLLGVSLPTISVYLDRYADFPVVQEGTNGREWQFDPIAVRAYMAAKREEEIRADASRQQELAQLGLPLGGEVANDVVGVVTPKDKLDHLRALKAEDELRLQRGYLVSVPDQRMAMVSAIARWNRTLHAALRQAGQDMGFPPAVIQSLTDRLGEAQKSFVRDLKLDAKPAEDLLV